VVNYPNEFEFTRITEFKYLTGEEHPKTVLVYEYPQAEGDPYYPISRSESTQLYKRYKVLADETRGVYFAGRLATYKYYNMDQVVAQALALFRRIMTKCASDEVADNLVRFGPGLGQPTRTSREPVSASEAVPGVVHAVLGSERHECKCGDAWAGARESRPEHVDSDDGFEMFLVR
jgi:hypothetical protein